ncbi:MAG: hypothetical protein A3F14_03980 [Gammaproteobacteria bacterium RIFCSPHIGHO2_12_FULL_43_28]|nr:MAG: hypothetical protein A3F14_03980 [Gammaproteobacteria bacterium RIFCSPHIGHO2_12_FULL_43_28]
MTQPKSSLSILGLELYVHLGWPDQERKEKQLVKLDIHLTFVNPPKACQSDLLTDTICYAGLIDQLHDYLANKTFHLIEHLTNEIYQFLKSCLPAGTMLRVILTKHPAITGLTGGICFSLANEK